MAFDQMMGVLGALVMRAVPARAEVVVVGDQDHLHFHCRCHEEGCHDDGV